MRLSFAMFDYQRVVHLELPDLTIHLLPEFRFHKSRMHEDRVDLYIMITT